VTSRDRLGLSSSGFDGLLGLVAGAVSVGIDLIQVREPDLPGVEMLALVRDCVALAGGSATAILVNDRLDIALAAGAAGVHLRGGSVSAATIRPHTPPGFLLGRSVHDAAEAQAVEQDGGVDYLTYGTVYRSRSKPGLAPQGAARLGEAVEGVTLPVLAIGGITVDNTGEVFGLGAAGVAAIDLFVGPDRREGVDGIRRVVEAIRQSYANSHGHGE
jgi:thiamine-phosphate pyrophosphorylase